MAVLSVIVLGVGGNKWRREERGLRLLDCSFNPKIARPWFGPCVEDALASDVVDRDLGSG